MADPIRIERRVAEEAVDELLGERLRDLLAAEAENETLRQELATSHDACASAMAEVEALKADLVAVAKQADNLREQAVYNGNQIHRLQRELAEARDERDRYREHSVALNSVGYRAAQALSDAKGEESYVGNPVKQVDALVAERDRLAAAAQRVLDLFDHGNVLGTIAAIPGLRDALDGGT